MAKSERLSRTHSLAADLIYAAFNVLKDNNGNLPSKQVVQEVEKRVELDEWAKERFQKTGYIRWQSLLHFFSIDCTKAGFLVKKKGYWYLTPEGEKALKLDKVALLKTAIKKYREWKARNKKEKTEDISEEPEGDIEPDPGSIVEQAVQTSSDAIKSHIFKMNAYEFQDLVAALLRGMGYYTPFVAPKGKDGGIDILAYRDPFGIESPRIKVQVKHRETGASVKEVRELIGTLQKEGDVGIFVSTGGFTADAKSAAINAHLHVELIDLDQFINLWQEFYKKLPDEDKNLMPLVPIYFLSPTE